MDQRDAFAVWVAQAVLETQGDSLSADTIAALAARADTSAELDAGLKPTGRGATRAGDMGLEFLAPVLPMLLVEFGRKLWDAYTDAMIEKGGEVLADLTVDRVKALLRQTWRGESPTVTLTEAEGRLRLAAVQVGLSETQVATLVASLRDPRMAEGLGAA